MFVFDIGYYWECIIGILILVLLQYSKSKHILCHNPFNGIAKCIDAFHSIEIRLIYASTCPNLWCIPSSLCGYKFDGNRHQIEFISWCISWFNINRCIRVYQILLRYCDAIFLISHSTDYFACHRFWSKCKRGLWNTVPIHW